MKLLNDVLSLKIVLDKQFVNSVSYIVLYWYCGYWYKKNLLINKINLINGTFSFKIVHGRSRIINSAGYNK